MASDIVLNTKIAKTTECGNRRTYTIVFRNIANAKRDEEGAAFPWDPLGEKMKKPLYSRLQYIIDDIKGIQGVDAVFLLEAGRPSQGISWTRMAATIEEETGLTYIGIYYLNGTESPFGKALFINRSRVAVRDIKQLYVSSLPTVPSGAHMGCDVLRVEFSPVEEGKIVIDQRATFCAVHAPMDYSARMLFAQWINKNHFYGDLFFGDFNTFPDDGGDLMIEHITQDGHLFEHTPDVPYTFSAFPQDVVPHPIDMKHTFGPPCEIIKETEDTVWVRHASVLDRVFARELVHTPRVIVYPDFRGSDHAMVSIQVRV